MTYLLEYGSYTLPAGLYPADPSASRAVTSAKIPRADGARIPTAFLDKRVMEVFANDGEAAIFTTVDAGANDLAIEAFATGGGARLEGARVWPMRPARLTLDRYRV